MARLIGWIRDLGLLIGVTLMLIKEEHPGWTAAAVATLISLLFTATAVAFVLSHTAPAAHWTAFVLPDGFFAATTWALVYFAVRSGWLKL